MKVSHRFVIIAALFITCLITANIVGVKMFSFGIFILPAAVVLFPISYIIGDILTEVYGYRWARRVIWLGFACNLLFVLVAWIGQLLPPAPGWEWQEAYESILGYTPRLLAASFGGYLVGEFANSFVLAKNEGPDPGTLAMEPDYQLHYSRGGTGYRNIYYRSLLRCPFLCADNNSVPLAGKGHF